MKKSTTTFVVGAGLLLGLSGCGISTWYNPISSSPGSISAATAGMMPDNKGPSFREGYADGCKSARGQYTKSSERFNNDSEYHEGWFAGRSACQYSQGS